MSFTKAFKREFKKQLRLALSAAIGFIIAFAWRDAIVEKINSATTTITGQTTVELSPVTTALIITALGVILLMILSKLLKEKKR